MSDFPPVQGVRPAAAPTRRPIRSVVVALLFACTTALAAAPPLDSLRHDGVPLRPLGEGRMRWFGLALYDATLWVPGTRLQWEQSFALDIRYARNFAGHRLAEASVDEIRRLGLADDDRLRRWGELMGRVFPDVRKGDRITGVYLPGVGAEFFHNGSSTGVIRDLDFARSFFSIWLDPRTREPKLRAALLGLG